MPIYEQYRTIPSDIRRRSTRESAREILKSVRLDPGNKMNSSVTLPNWQAARLRYAVAKLKIAGVKTPRIQIFSTVIRLSQRKVRRLRCQAHRTKRRNTKDYSYQKISHRWPPEDYNILHGRADHAKISGSYILDLALRLYLQAAVAILLGEESMSLKVWSTQKQAHVTKTTSLTSLLAILGFCGIYQRDTEISTAWRVKFSVEMGSPP